MRTFHIFKISPEFKILVAKHPFNLYETMEKIYFFEHENISIAYRIFGSIAIPFNKNGLNEEISKIFNEDHNYAVFNNTHRFNNYWTKEVSELKVHNAYMTIQSNVEHPLFFDALMKQENLFVCDFKNKDYFWLKELFIPS